MFKKKYRQVYLIHQATDVNYSLCKVLNSYKSEEEVYNDLKKLLSGKLNEKNLLQKFNE